MISSKDFGILTYSIKYRDYLRSIRNGQIERAEKMIARGERSTGRKRPNNPKRLIATDHATQDGEVEKKAVSYIDQKRIDEEEKYDGFYAVCTNLEDEPETIIKVNKRHWQIEDYFRIMKTDFEARPVYVKRKDRILICCLIIIRDELHPFLSCHLAHASYIGFRRLVIIYYEDAQTSENPVFSRPFRSFSSCFFVSDLL